MTRLAIGLVFELLGSYPRQPGDPPDIDAEYEPEETIQALEAAIRRLGHRPLRIGGPEDLLAQLGSGKLPALDAAFNIAEARGGRNREAWAPVLLEMARIPTLGSDALTLSLTLDKYWAASVVARAGVSVPAQRVVASVADLKAGTLPGPFPLFAKPRWEGTAKGIRASSKVLDFASLEREVQRITRDYRQPALIEEFLPGAEYTVTIVGNDPPRALPVLQRALDAATGIGAHAIAEAGGPPLETHLPGHLDAALEAELGKLALCAYEQLECLDFARADFRLDTAGRPRFLEMNPLPTFAPHGTFGVLAELEGRPLDALIADVIRAGLARLGVG
ncbi:MAG TPA: D-alanine--D-alanine ligase [Myxococcota bacterium]|nr:D-alanine--D-alanine ligase [Myxococcota bacterium]